MSDSERGQVEASAAQVYEEFYLPALFQEWTGRVAQAAQLQPGQRVLDVACGTGVLAREAAARVGPQGSVVGLDVNEGMLAVAAAKAPGIEWHNAPAEALPLDEGSFDAVVSQFGLMFFDDRYKALAEMVRVLRPGGRLAVAVWDTLENSPGYAAMVALLQRLFGAEVAGALRSPFVLGDTAALAALFAEAGLPDTTVQTITGTARFPSIEAWVYTDAKGWTFSGALDEAQFDRLVAEAQTELSRFALPDGTVLFDSPAHIVSAAKP